VAAVITLTTDFGTQDSYVAEMKAVILGLHAAVHLVDVTHHVKAHDVLEGALAVEAMAAVCPPGTIHLAVVDPGVGTSRRGLALAAGDQLFVGPDNGIFTAMLGRRGWKAFELRAAAYRRATVSATFHGRDVFAPAAAHLALGVPPSHFGPRVTDPVRLPWAAARSAADVIDGEVIHVDRFGNLVTSIAAEAVQRLAAGTGGGVAIRIAGRVVPLVRTYGELAPQAAGALVGSHGRLEVAVREGSAAARLRAGRGAGVRVRVSRRSTARTSSPVRRGRR
jgi:S-adenosyl-L-methionine hydrolase (adenosine-forming)